MNVQDAVDKYKELPVGVKASFWYVICNVLQRGISFFTTPVFTRLMSTEQYGQVTVYNSWLEIFTIFATLNLFYGVYNNAITKYPDRKDTVTSSMLGLCSCITISFFLFYIIFRSTINALTGMSTFITSWLFAEVLFIPAFRFWSARQRYEYMYKKLIVFSLLMTVLTPALGIPAVLFCHEKGEAKIVTGIIAQLIVCIYLYFKLFRDGEQFFDKKYWLYALTFNLPLIPHYLSSTILHQSDRIMIDRMCGTDKAGIYGLAYTIGALTVMFNQAIMSSFTPYTYQNLKQGKFDNIRKYTNYLVIIVGTICLLVIIVAPEIIWVLGGKKYMEGIWIIAPVAASMMFTFLYSLYGNIEFYYEENYFIMIASVMAAGLNIVLNYIYIRKYGFLAVGYTTLASYATYAFAHYLFSTNVLKRHSAPDNLYNNGFLLVASLTVIVLSAIIMVLYDYPAIRYLLAVLSLVVIYLSRSKIILLIKNLRGIT